MKRIESRCVCDRLPAKLRPCAECQKLERKRYLQSLNRREERNISETTGNRFRY